MAVDAAELVAAWAAAASQPPVRQHLRPCWDVRVVSLVGALTRPSEGDRGVTDDPTAAAWDGAVLDLIAATAPAARLDGVASCPACGQRMDVSLAPPDSTTGARGSGTVVVRVDGTGPVPGVVVTARVPTLADLDAALAAALPAAGDRFREADDDLAVAVAALVERLVVDVTDEGGTEQPAGARAALLADEALLAALDRAIEEAEPAVVDPIELACPDCGHRWSARVALEDFAWAVTERAAVALLDEVHRLARAYGWTHDTVLALPAAVRRQYLERVG